MTRRHRLCFLRLYSLPSERKPTSRQFQNVNVTPNEEQDNMQERERERPALDQ